MKLDTSKMSRGELIEKIIEYKDHAEKYREIITFMDLDKQEFFEMHKIVQQLRKLSGNTTKNPEHCCQAFEYIRDTLQKIVREKND